MKTSGLLKYGVCALIAALTVAYAVPASAHCEIPCGIYDDATRIKLLNEHITTVEKSINQIVELSAAEEKNVNQCVRWVLNKEEHCNKIQEIAVQYFLTQRVKPVGADADLAAKRKYVTQLTLLHQIVVHAMKAKQTTDTAHTDKLRELVHQFEHAYLDKE